MNATAVGVRTTGKRRRRALKKNLLGHLFIAPWLIGFFWFQAGPLLLSVFLSFVNWMYTGAPEWVGLANFKEMFASELFYKSLYNTAYYTFSAVGLQILVSFLAALAVN